jgi:hypothetical protein
MRSLAIALVMATVVSCVGLVAWRAEAMVGAGAAQLNATAKSSQPIVHAACGGRGEHCPPGYTWNGHACVPC